MSEIEIRPGVLSTKRDSKTETNLMNQRLVIKQNEGFLLTYKGYLVHELVRSYMIVSNASDVTTNFCISPEVTEKYEKRISELCKLLNVPYESRSKSISRYDRRLTAAGYPYWKMVA